eukprot:SAG31_NODE_84_length_27014_cov_3.743006_15_plen_598_part_00
MATQKIPAMANALCAKYTSCSDCADACSTTGGKVGCVWCNTTGPTPAEQGFCWPGAGPCKAPPITQAAARPIVLSIGDSISASYTGYHLNVVDLLQKSFAGTGLRPLVAEADSGSLPILSLTNAVTSLTGLLGNTTGQLPSQAWDVVTYNSGLHDCVDKGMLTNASFYESELRKVLTLLKHAAHTAYFVTSTPFNWNDTFSTKQFPGDDSCSVLVHGCFPSSMPCTTGMGNCSTMACVLQRNSIARRLVEEAGIELLDLYDYVEQFCSKGVVSKHGNYTECAIQSSGLHFFNTAPMPSGQQYTGLAIANAVVRGLPASTLAHNPDSPDPGCTAKGTLTRLDLVDTPLRCGSPSPNRSARHDLPTVLIVGDSSSATCSGYGPTVREILEHPRPRVANGPKIPEATTGPLARVFHSGGWTGTWPINAPSGIAGANENAGNSSTGALCAPHWFADGGWDVITLSFGLEDCKIGQVVASTTYIANLEKIYEGAHDALNPGGSIVWVSTLLVQANNSVVDKDCVKRCNDLASKIFSEKSDVVVADLHGAMEKVCAEPYAPWCALQKHNNTQLTASGRQFSGIVVAHAVAPLLGPAWAAKTHE